MTTATGSLIEEETRRRVTKEGAQRAAGRDLLETAFDVMRQATDAPSKFLRLGAMMVIAVLLSARSFFRFGSQLMRVNLFAAAIAESSLFRKSEPIRWGRGVLAVVDPDSLLPSAGSVEGLMEALKDRPDGLVTFDELARFFARSKKDFNADLPQFYCELADCTPIRERRREGGLQSIERPIVSLLGATAPSPLLEYTGQKDCASGLLPRFLMVRVEKSDVEREPFPPSMNIAARDLYVSMLKELVAGLKGETEFTFTPGARKCFVAFDKEAHAEFRGSEMSAFVERAMPMTLKIACIIAFARRQVFAVEDVDVAEAAVWAQESLEADRQLVGEIETQETDDGTLAAADKVRGTLARLLTKFKTRAPHSELLRATHLSAPNCRRGLLHLVECGEIMPMPDGAAMGWGARPTLEVEIQDEAARAKAIQTSVLISKDYFYPPKNGKGGAL